MTGGMQVLTTGNFVCLFLFFAGAIMDVMNQKGARVSELCRPVNVHRDQETSTG